MKLLPNKMKKLGAFMAPLGLIFWLMMQFDVFYNLLDQFMPERVLFVINVTIAITSFFSFLIGMYFLIFSREKIEDELARETRLSSFQYAAFVQFLYIIIGFIFFLVVGEPEEGGFMTFFVTVVLLFYLVYIARFNYLFHLKFRNED